MLGGRKNDTPEFLRDIFIALNGLIFLS